MRALLERIANEPVLVTAVILAVGNLIGQDLSDLAHSAESVIVVVAAIIARHFVTPTRKLSG